MQSSKDARPYAPGSKSDGGAGFGTAAEFDELASAVSALTSDDLRGLSDSLGAGDTWVSDHGHGHIGGGFLANQY